MDSAMLSANYTIPYLCAAATLLLVVIIPSLYRQEKAIPIINPPSLFDLGPARVVGDFVLSAWKILYDPKLGIKPRPFRVWSDLGLVTVLTPEHGEEIRNDRRFSFTGVLEYMFQAKLPGFESYGQAMADWQPVQNVVKQKITRNLSKLTQVLVQFCSESTQNALGSPKDWTPIVVKDEIVKVVSRMSSRVFVGEKLCYNEQWNNLIISYGAESAQEAQSLKLWPKLLRPFIIWVRPSSARLRAQVKEAEAFINAQLEERRSSNGDDEFDDAIQGFEDLAKGRSYSAGATQLMLAIVAIMTTADLLTQALLDIVHNPDVIEPLREEIMSVLTKHGWTKAGLAEMKLLDSVLKESQRLKPAQITGMHRKLSEAVHLKDGTKLAAGSITTVSAERMWNQDVYENPHDFKGDRFLNLRNQSEGNDSRYQLVGTSTDHLGFGHGRHACPGRFFAADEAKIALCFLLTSYDWKAISENPRPPRVFGFFHEADHEAKVLIRKRQSECLFLRFKEMN